MTTAQQTTVWDERATTAQNSLDHFFGAEEPQLLHNSYPAGDDSTFNYWWLAHLMDARIDAFERTGDTAWLAQADAVYRNVLERNGGSLFNDYFDDMLWYALAILLLYDATGNAQYIADARSIWEHVVAHGWNDTMGPSVAWRKQQPYYKNTPANGPFVILSARLFRRDDDPRYLEYALRTYRWLSQTLVRPDGFVEDGINREENGQVDLHWRFTYNQGLYVGAGVALAQATGDRGHLDDATRTALTALGTLAEDGMFRQEGAGGDEGLFKGIYYRYVGELLTELPPDSEAARTLEEFLRTSTDALWRNAQVGSLLLAGDDWSAPAPEKVDFSTQLSAIMALELRARRERSPLLD